MKIAVSAEGRNMSSVDPRFSRAKGFIIYDTGGSEPAYVDNEQNLESA